MKVKVGENSLFQRIESKDTIVSNLKQVERENQEGPPVHHAGTNYLVERYNLVFSQASKSISNTTQVLNHTQTVRLANFINDYVVKERLSPENISLVLRLINRTSIWLSKRCQLRRKKIKRVILNPSYTIASM